MTTVNQDQDLEEGQNQGQDDTGAANTVDILGMSDEEFLKQSSTLLASATAAPAVTEAPAAATTKTDTDTEGGDDAGKTEVQNQEQKAADTKVEDTGTDPNAGQEQGNKADEGKENQDKQRGPDGKFVAKDKVTDAADSATGDKKDDKAGHDQGQPVDYKAAYDKLLAPFKANGRDIRVENVDEAIRLMQMGANYNKKMAALKPNLALLKTLENNGLLNADKINFLIDLEKKNPEAISKLIQDSGINPLDISADKAGAYKPGNHGVHDSEIELDQVLDELKDSPKYNDTLVLVSKDWDAKSKQVIANQPQLLKVINAHMESGIFDLVATEVERSKLFGNLQGLSDLEAYRQVGDAMAKDGKFDHLTKKPGQASPAGQQTPVAKVVVPPNPKQADDSKRDAQRRAAAPAKGVAPAAKANDGVNPLALSDEDFLKLKQTF